MAKFQIYKEFRLTDLHLTSYNTTQHKFGYIFLV